MKNRVWPFAIGLLLLSACGKDKEKNPQPKAVTSISENGAATASFREYEVTGILQGNDQDYVIIQGLTSSGKYLRVGYVKRAGDATGTFSYIQGLYETQTNFHIAGSGSATYSVSTGLVSGTFALTFPNNQQVSGSFTDLKPR